MKSNRFISTNPEIMGGMPVIVGTRIPMARIIFLLKEGYTIDAIQEDYSWVDKKKIEGAINELIHNLQDNHNAPKVS